MNYQQPPQVIQQQAPDRRALAQAMQQGGGIQEGMAPLNSFLQSQVMGQLKDNKALENAGMNNNFGPQGMPIDQWMGMK